MARDKTPASIGKIIRKRMICLVAAAISTLPLKNIYSDTLLQQPQDETKQFLNSKSAQSSVGDHKEASMDKLMQSIVEVKVNALANARTAKTFGNSRVGTGVVIDMSGLIVTSGDVVAEAGNISVKFHDGSEVEANFVAYDHKTGLGLVRAETGQPTVAIELGNSSKVRKNDVMMVIPSSGEADAVAVKVGKIENYSGGWEYMIDNALHTFPPSTLFSGAALVSDAARLLGIGSLVSIDIDIDPKVRVPGNVFIPVDTLASVLGKLLLIGRSDSPARRPWIGLDVKETKRGVAVSAVTTDGPAESAGVRNGDVLIALNRKKINGQNDYLRKLWATYKPGDEVELMLLRRSEYQSIKVVAADYYDWLKKPDQAAQLSVLED